MNYLNNAQPYRISNSCTKRIPGHFGNHASPRPTSLPRGAINPAARSRNRRRLLGRVDTFWRSELTTSVVTCADLRRHLKSISVEYLQPEQDSKDDSGTIVQLQGNLHRFSLDDVLVRTVIFICRKLILNIKY